MSKVEGGGGFRLTPPPPLVKASCNYFFFEASRVKLTAIFQSNFDPNNLSNKINRDNRWCSRKYKHACSNYFAVKKFASREKKLSSGKPVSEGFPPSVISPSPGPNP